MSKHVHLRAAAGIALAALAPILVARQAPTYSIVPLDTRVSERWPVPGAFAIRRSVAGPAITLNIAWSGRARRNIDYGSSNTTTVTIPSGEREAWVTVTPLRDRIRESAETIVLSLPAQAVSGTITLDDDTGVPTEREANRFLIQAAFGSDPATLAEVRRLGFSGWIDAQLIRPSTYLRPVLDRRAAEGKPNFHPATKIAFWERAMMPLPATAGPLPDPLRQRVAYSLMQIFVISQNIDALSLNSPGVATYYDGLMDGAFGNFRDLLKRVSLSPAMGIYLSHLGNRKADPTLNRFPDENYAREVMQLFSIGLWELNADGTRKLRDGKPIPTYTNVDIREYARVFTGVNWGGPGATGWFWDPQDYNHPMKLWDEFHDLEPKRLLGGVVTPRRTSGGGTSGVAAMADVDAAIDSLFNHPNVGPFIGRLLIQRLVTSNPSPAYIGRVSAAFANNGRGVRGDMGAVVRAILLDPEARSYEITTGKSWGKKREPYLTLLNLAKTFDAAPANGDYENATYLYDELRQEIFQSPSVFNFYLPDHRPSGEMARADVKGPEFQIMTAVTAHGALNLSYKMIVEDLSRWGGPPEQLIRLKPVELLPLADRPDVLVERAALRLLDRPLRPRTFRIIRDAVDRMPPATSDVTRRDRVNMCLTLLVSSPDFQIQK